MYANDALNNRALIYEFMLATFKDSLPYLFHSFRNKYFNKISLGSMLYFQNKFICFEKTHGFPINMQ